MATLPTILFENSSTEDTSINGSSDLILPPIWMYTIPFQIPIFILCVFGNIMVCVAIYRMRCNKYAPRSSENMLILLCNMAVADLVGGLLAMPLSIVLSIDPKYELSAVPCVMQTIVVRLCFGVSLLTMCVLSIDRYFVLCCTPKKEMNIKLALALVWITPCLSFLMSVIRASNYRTDPYLQLCIINFSEEDIVLQILENAATGAFYIFGLVCLSIFYWKVYATVCKSMKASTDIGVRKKIDAAKVQRKIALMLIATVVSFFICWTPLFIYVIIVALPEWYIEDIPRGISVSIMWFVYLQSAVNPIIYSVGSKHMRKEFISALKCAKIKVTPSFPSISQSLDSQST